MMVPKIRRFFADCRHRQWADLAVRSREWGESAPLPGGPAFDAWHGMMSACQTLIELLRNRTIEMLFPDAHEHLAMRNLVSAP